MKKSIAFTLCLGLCAISALGQGAVNFNTRVTGAGGVVAPIYGPVPGSASVSVRGNATTNGGTANYTGAALLAGTGYSAELLGGSSAATLASSLTANGSVTFRTAASFAGFITPPANAPTYQGAGGTPFVFQIRVWDNGGGTVNTWALALARQDLAKGVSDLIGPINLVEPPGTPNNLVGLTSFSLTVVPEPGVIALGVLGLGALLLRRRK